MEDKRYVLLNSHFMDGDNSMSVAFPDGTVVKYVPERTCQMVDIPDGWEDADGVIWPDCWVCDTCGSYTLGVLSHPHTIDTPSYCPNCGARVKESE